MCYTVDEHFVDCQHTGTCRFQPRDKDGRWKEKINVGWGGRGDEVGFRREKKEKEKREMSGQVMHGERVGKGKG